tara:strand:- start:213 stop:1295 length:1083 start_codon:yes stop_codon:yes gene_type:complete
MNKETFNQLVKEPSLVDPKYKSELAQLVASFPYASNLKLLHLSALLNDTDVHFERELKKTTCYISDRRVLKKIIQQPIDKSQYIIKEIESPLRVVETEVQLDTGNITSAQDEVVESHLSIDTTTQIEEKIEITPEVKVPDTRKEIIESEISNEVTPQLEKETKITTDIKVESTEVKKEIIESEIPKETEKSETPEIISELDQQIIASAVNASLSIEVDETEIKDEEQEVKITEEVISQENPDEKKSFLDWIGAERSLEKTNIPDPKVQERIEFRKKAEDLINQFIIDQPRIDVKKEFFSPGNMAKKSIEDQNEIVSETLAKVYAAQGNISKAIGTYEQLILKNPEKKSYFASLIKDLKSI